MRAGAVRAAGALVGVLLLAGCGDRIGAAEALAAARGEAATLQLPPGTLPQQAIPTAPRTVVPEPATPKTPIGPGESAARAAPAAEVPAQAAATRPRAGAVPPKTTSQAAPAASGSARAVAAKCPAGLPPLRLGQVGAFSGVVGPLTETGRTGLAVWARAANAADGVACRQVQIFSLDDGADPARTAAAVADLVQQKRVVALVATFSELTQAALKAAAERFEVPVIGGVTVAYEWHESPYLFPQGASLRSQAYALARQAVLDGKGKMAMLYCVETSTCTRIAKELEGSLGKRAGLDVVYSSPVSLVATDYTAQCQNAKSLGATSLGVAMDGSAVSRVVRSCAALGYYPVLVTSAFVLGPVGAADAGIRRNGVLTENITAPWMLSDTKGQRDFQAAMKVHAPGVAAESGSILAWTSGRLLEAALARLNATDRIGPLGSREVLTGLGRIRRETLDGLTPPITFLPGKPAPDVECVYYVRLGENGWSAPNGTRFSCPD
ncbi:MAG: ABC transporter substrate-binding protein [Sporichthyaceae bacterium]